jgi:murein DD-endopeptidase MepM/ murein hydrolase activator NlpD
MGARGWILVLIVCVAIGWYNNGGSEVLRVTYRVMELETRAPDKVLVMPVEGVSPARIADTWHSRRDRNRKHEGQDIFAPKGTAVRSATDGVVVRVGPDRLGGNTVSVLGSGARDYYYAHLDRYADRLHVGELVTAGEVIGYVGNTGNARGTPPHLHFGVYTAVGAINPMPLLKAGANDGQAAAG